MPDKGTPTKPISLEGATYSSPPCFLHETDPGYQVQTPDQQQQKDVARWRKAERDRLISARLAQSNEQRQHSTEAIIARLNEKIGDANGVIVSCYWPFRGEPDLRVWMEEVTRRGGVCALPVVSQKRAPLTFRAWRAGEELEKGVWNIPVPARGQEVIPDIVIAPVVGFDRNGYRLGYGGGFFDRTLAAAPNRPLALGVGYAMQEIPTIYPQPHDIPMSFILTERAAIARP